MLSLLIGLSAMAAQEPVVVFDMGSLFTKDLRDPEQRRAFWDETHLVASLQGLVNRDAPRLFIRYNKPDAFWWDHMTREGGWLHGREVQEAQSVDSLLERFKSFYKGAVVWDERVPATSNLASTLAGCDDLLCLRYDPSPASVFTRVTQGDNALPVARRLMTDDGGPLFTGSGVIADTSLPSTGSPKCDAYLWLVEHYVKTGRANPHRMGYYLDGYWFTCWDQGSPQNHTVTNHDFVIANKGVFFDLGVWDDETPVDDRSQPPGTDADTLRTLLRACYDQFAGNGVIHAAGFVPWAYKYTTHGTAGGTHEPVPTEWKYAEILSCFNAYMDADALGYSAMANASFFQHFPLPQRLEQNPKPTIADLQARGLIDADGRVAPKRFVAHYVGDYDAAAWLYWKLPEVWTDPKRGEVPLNWAFNPNLCERFPVGMAWARATRTPNDFFIAGDSGAGYVNPGLLSEPRWHSDLPSGMAAWEKHCRQFYEQWDLSVTGFVIDGFGPGLTEEGLDAYARFSPDGIVAQKIPDQGLHAGMPYIRMGGDLPGDPKDAAAMISGQLRGRAPRFLVVRSILKSPSWYAAISDALKERDADVVVVDMYTLFRLLKRHEENRLKEGDEPSPYADARAVTAVPSKEEGLWPVFHADGPYEVTTVDGVACWQVSLHQPGHYLYFAVDDDFADGAEGSVVVRVTYSDVGEGSIGMHYDSTDRAAAHGGTYKDAPSVKLTNTGEWQTHRFVLDDVRFGNGQNGGADFRLFADGADLCVRSIVVTRR